MLEPPDIAISELRDCLSESFGLSIDTITFLPIGADVNTAVYRADAHDGTSYFLKLRRGTMFEAAVVVPHLLHDSGITRVIAPFETGDGQLWTRVGEFVLALFPFIPGQDGFDHELSDQHWIELGVTLRGLHETKIPATLGQTIPRETFNSHFRDSVRSFQRQVETTTYSDPIAEQMAAIMREERDLISRLIDRAEQLGGELHDRSERLERVLCHADIHAGNVLITDTDALYVVDWDTLTIAPRERDLMFIGGGIGTDAWSSPRASALFYQGYGQIEVDPSAIAYYRYERIVEDFAAYCEQLLLTDDGGDDRAQSLHYFSSQFQPGNVIEIAIASDPEQHLEMG